MGLTEEVVCYRDLVLMAWRRTRRGSVLVMVMLGL